MIYAKDMSSSNGYFSHDFKSNFEAEEEEEQEAEAEAESIK